MAQYATGGALKVGTVYFALNSVLLIAALHWAMPFRELSETVRRMSDGKETLLAPVLKCVAAAVVTQIAADLCRDASQSALASAIETAGLFCAAAVAVPSVLSLVNMAASFL